MAAAGSEEATQGPGTESSLPTKVSESSNIPRIRGFEVPTAGISPLNPERKVSGGAAIPAADPAFGNGERIEKAVPQAKTPPACLAGLRVLDLSSGSPRAANGSGSASSGRLTPASESGATGGAMSPSKLLRKFELFSNNPRGSSLPASPSHGPRSTSRAKLSQDDFHAKVVSSLEVGAHHSRHNSGSIKVSSALDDVVPALERILDEATLTPDQRNDLQYSLQVILSRTLYEPTVKSPSTPPSPRSNRRSTLNLVSPKLELDEETQRWLAHEYRLDQYTVPDKYSLSMSLPSAFSNQLNKTGSGISRSFTFGRSPGLSPLAQSSPRGRKKVEEPTFEAGKGETPPPERPVEKEVEKQVEEKVENQVEKELVATETAKVLTKIHDLDFDVFELNAANQGEALKCLATAIFTELGLCEKLGIDKGTMDAFLTAIQAGYRQVPYHNGCHAADVLHAAYLLITRCFLEEWMTDEEVFSLLVAAIVHDFRHPGISNAFLIASKDPLAILYNDRAVLENHHLASAFMEMYKSGQNILGHFSVEQQKAIRARIIQLVLITDMSEHFEFAGRFKTRVLGPGFNLEKEENRICILQMVLKCADLNSAAKPQKLAVDWARRIMDEFFNQGDKEKQLGLPVSPMCDKEAANIPKQQLRFIEFIVQPLYEMFAEHCPALEEWLQGLEANRGYWQSQMKDEPQSQSNIRRATVNKIL
ncbi:Cyclic nucleotide phosphodiesterase [Klebsormidium nitens]|uniref:Phosphodiesterase n=1 Tax=Klebsormidium nitens TaxID=105231 RepID=A0A0U9HHT7_KLENI|nr:Cyclic nucleotide phosphodiesterase [Klebsormidium nitens]|eukprot:GAQ77586.1 Cyclic nucleotide phosphodiesterase [Klebsormidium nitens]